MSFIKQNSSRFKDALIKEAQGLELLKQHCGQIKIPKVISVSEKELVIEKIPVVSCKPEQMYKLGVELGKLHSKKFPQFGLNYDNYIGLSSQKNILSDNWGEFFIEYRLKFQIDLIKNCGVKSYFTKTLKEKASCLIDLMNSTCAHPSLVHGDLWSGNYMCSENDVWLIDPAVYYGDSEVDIAMTEMFGGFSSEFYNGYASVKTLTKDYIKKRELYNLYHYLNHYNLFGESYLEKAKSILMGL